MRSVLLFTSMLALCATVSAHEWSDAKGRYKIEADFVEAKVTLRLRNGQTKVVDMKMLSKADQQFIMKTLGENTPPANNQQPQIQLAKLVDDLEIALDGNDKAKIIAATKAIRLVDSTCRDVQPIVQRILKGRNTEEIARWMLFEVGSDAVWAADILLTMDEGLNSEKYRLDPHRMYGLSIHFQPRDLAIARDRLDSRRELTRSLAEFHGKDQRVKQLFGTRLEQLKSAPSPEERAKAAYWLSRALAISGDVLPALQHSAKADVAPPVRLAAMLSLGGFGITAKPAIPVIVEGYESAENDETQFNLLLVLATIQNDCPQLKKIIFNVLEDYKRGRDSKGSKTSTACKTLEAIQLQGAWAVPQLLDAAEYGLAKKRGDFMTISNALISVGRGDARVVKFYERAAKDGPQEFRVHCDSAAKQLRPLLKP
jgi:hypothetical protein